MFRRQAANPSFIAAATRASCPSVPSQKKYFSSTLPLAGVKVTRKRLDGSTPKLDAVPKASSKPIISSAPTDYQRDQKFLFFVAVGALFWYLTYRMHHKQHHNTHTRSDSVTIRLNDIDYVLTPEEHKIFLNLLRARFGSELVDQLVIKDPHHDWEATLPQLQKAEEEAIEYLQRHFGRIGELGDTQNPVKWDPKAPTDFMNSVNTGDIVIFSCYGPLGGMVKFTESLQFKGTHFEHAGIIMDQIKDPESGKVVDAVLNEATFNTKEKLRDYYTDEVYKALRNIPFSQKIYECKEKYEYIAIRRLKPEVRARLNLSTGPESPATDTVNRKKMWDVIHSVQDPDTDFPLVDSWSGFWSTFWVAANRNLNRHLTWESCVVPGGRGVFCSQVVAEVLYRWKLLPTNRTKAERLDVSAMWSPPMFCTHADYINDFYEKEVFIDCPDMKWSTVGSMADSVIEMIIEARGGDKEEAISGNLQ